MRKGEDWPAHSNRGNLWSEMVANKAEWVPGILKGGSSQGSFFPLVKFANAYEDVILDAEDVETLNSFPESYDMDFLTTFTSGTSIRTTNANAVIEALKHALSKMKVGESRKVGGPKKLRDGQHPLARCLIDMLASLEHHELELKRF